MSDALRFRHILTARGIERHRCLRLDADGGIAAIEPIAAEAGIRYDGWLALPGMPNAHSHAFQRALAGQGEATRGDVAGGGDSFWSWRQAMYGVAANISPDDLHAIAARAYADMLRGGYTSVAEFHYLHHLPDGTHSPAMAEALIAAAADVGIRLVLLPVYYRRGGFDRAATPAQRRFVHAGVDEYLTLLSDLTGVALGIAPHSLRAVPPEELAPLETAAVAVLGEDFPRHIHIAEQPAEVEACQGALGATPIDVLADAVALSERWQLIHATHATEAELDRVIAAGAGVVLCPLTEAYLGDGIFPARRFVARGGQLSIGSDSNVRLDAVEELRLLEYGQRLAAGRRACLADETGLGASLWRRCAAGGARALRQPVGSLAVGASADIVALDPAHPALAGLPPERALDALVTGGDGGCVADVWVGGRRRVSGGALADADRIDRDYRRALAALGLGYDGQQAV
jgi:formiminoglutamate deiminase